jgi:hypothetical protein
VAEFPYRVAAIMGSLRTPDGHPAIDNIWLHMHERPALFGPDSPSTDSTSEFEGRLWDANILRANHELTFTLLMDIADDAEGTFEITLGNECSLTPRMWFAPDGADTVPMPIELIGNNHPITVRITVVPRH